MERSNPAAIASLHHGRGQPDRQIYPILANETCSFFAADFDKSTSRDDVAAFLAACKAHGVPAALERSRSGQGGHVWIFFAESVPAFLGRPPGAHLVTEAMEQDRAGRRLWQFARAAPATQSSLERQ